MKASDMLRNNNGLKTTQSVLNKQQSGADAANKVAQTQAPATALAVSAAFSASIPIC
jgi:hypothetical protein